MVIKKVSSSNEPPILKMVRILRRLLRNAFFVTKRVRVMNELREKTYPACETPQVALSIADGRGPGQPQRLPISASPIGTADASGDRHRDGMTNVTHQQ